MKLQKLYIPTKDDNIYEWNLNPKVNILNGDNNLLKTSILKSIHTTVQSMKSEQKHDPKFLMEFTQDTKSPDSIYITPAVPLYKLMDYIFKFKVDKTYTAIDVLIQDLLSRFNPSDNEKFLMTLHEFMPTYIPDLNIHEQELSFMQRYLIYILLSVVNTNEKPVILLMDSVGGYLQPRWQQIIIKEILHINPNMQIIISTQIQNIIDGCKKHVPNTSVVTINECDRM